VSGTIPDQEARTRFASELDGNFSVIAPAGVGKTRSIVDRVAAIAAAENAEDILPRLAVVTYTNKAADEMRQRARNRILEQEGGALRIGLFNRAFFGTIHGFCLGLLSRHGRHLGLPGTLQHIAGDSETLAWTRFLRRLQLPDDRLEMSPSDWTELTRRIPADSLVELGRKAPGPVRAPALTGPCPDVDVKPVLDFPEKGRGADNIRLGKHLAGEYVRLCGAGAAFVPLPERPGEAREFREAWNDAFAPVKEWLGAASLIVADRVSNAFLDFRVREGTLTYADQILLVLHLLRKPDTARLLRAHRWVILLDEAQDTDPVQFRVLLELARPPDTEPDWIEAGGPPPDRGRFCMVGDPQQSIYSRRANLDFYKKVRERLVESGAADELVFQVTFRCSRNVISFANAACPAMLNGLGGQVMYVPLMPRPDAPDGGVVRLPLMQSAPPETAGRPRAADSAEAEANQVAEWLARLTPQRMGIADWSKAAIICMRHSWLDTFETALKKAGLGFVRRSQQAIHGDDPAFAWMTALLRIFTHPDDGFETVGVLREVFGISDDALFRFGHGESGAFRLREDADSASPTGRAISALASLRLSCSALPLYDAAREVVCQAQLAARLRAIGAHEPEASLRRLLLLAADAETRGLTIADWAGELEQLYGEEIEPEPGATNEINLITGHASKGLEWDVVIIPFLFRQIHHKDDPYPRLITAPDESASPAFDSSWIGEDLKTAITAAGAREDQRLMYVAMTRARSFLVLVDDRTLFPKDKGSLGERLGLIESAPDAWKRLPCEPPPRKRAAARKPPGKHARPKTPVPVKAEEFELAASNARNFPRRILPHTLAKSTADHEPETELLKLEDGETTSAIEYGLWWHSLMESLDWRSRASWDASFSTALASCPDTGRAKADWDRFIRSELAAILSAPGAAISTEVPFILPRLPDSSVEGFIDLVAATAEHGPWLVIDWKTNLPGPGGMAALAEIYAPQLNAYREAMSACMPGREFKALLYSTSLGKHVEIVPATGSIPAPDLSLRS